MHGSPSRRNPGAVRALIIACAAVMLLSVAHGQSIDTITFSGNHALTTAQLRDLMRLPSGSVLERGAFESSVDAVLDAYENLGYPFAEIALGSLSETAGRRLQIDLAINEGSMVTVRDVASAGKIETSPDVIRRAAGVDLNRPYRQQQVDRIRANLERLQIFASVGEPALQMRTPRDAVIGVPLVEGNTTLLDAIVGYLPGNAASAGYFVGAVDVSFLNLFASARKLGLHWQKKEVASQDLWVTYHEPWLFGLPLAMDLRVEQHVQDTAYTKRAGEIGASVLIGSGFTFTGLLNASATDPGSAQSPVGHAREYGAGVTLLYDVRDDPLCPRSGASYASHYMAGTKSVGGVSAAIQRVDIHAEIDQLLLKQSVGVLSMSAAVVSSSLLDDGDLLRVGGVASVRGYRDNQFRATRAAWGTGEFRQLIAPRSYLFAFADAGYYMRGATLAYSDTQQDLLIGYGVGIQTESPLGLLRVSLALGKDDSFGQAKVHFSVVNRF